MKKVISLVLTVLFALSMVCTTAFAANNDGFAPYGFSWYDSENKVWHVQFYEYDGKAEAYRISDRVVVKDGLLYDMAGTVIVSDVATYAEDKPTVAFDAEGYLYFTASNGETRRMDGSLSNTYAVNTFNCKYFTTDEEALAIKATGTNGAKMLSAIQFTGSYARHLDPVIVEGYVKTYAFEGNPEKIVYDAYYDNKVVSTIYCKDANVWSETFKHLLSQKSKGAKFVGFNPQYGVFVYDFYAEELNLYKYEEGYQKSYTLYNDIMVYYYIHDAKGFVTGAVTNKATYSFSTELKFPGSISNSNGNNSSGNGSTAVSTGIVTMVKNFQSKSMAYNGDTFLGTLSLKNNKAFWKGEELTNSANSVDIGISGSLTPYWINGDDDLYCFNGTTSQLVATNVLRLKYDDSGRAVQYKASDGAWYDLW